MKMLRPYLYLSQLSIIIAGMEEYTLPFSFEEEKKETAAEAGENILTVTEVNRMARLALEKISVTVQGEISGLNTRYSYFVYFDLRDENAAIPAILTQRQFNELDFKVDDGTLVVVRGMLSLYERQGKYQIKVDEVRPFGEGDLQRRIEALKRKLHKEGLFDDARKKVLPGMPQRIGVVTSLRGAAVRDVTVTLKRRFPATRVFIRGVQVQGESAAGQICSALRLFERDFPVDLVILARGGGSLQDLEPFNTEEVARAIASMEVPVITGVGHEPDVTIADLVADYRASTPTGAAEAAVPDRAQVMALLGKYATVYQRHAAGNLSSAQRALEGIRSRPVFSGSGYLLSSFMQRYERAATALPGSPKRGFMKAFNRLELILSRPVFRKPEQLLARYGLEAESAGEKLPRSVLNHVNKQRSLIEKVESGLKALSPLAVLDRGYSITFNQETGEVIRSPGDAEKGTALRIRLAKGELRADVTGKE